MEEPRAEVGRDELSRDVKMNNRNVHFDTPLTYPLLSAERLQLDAVETVCQLIQHLREAETHSSHTEGKFLKIRYG